MMNGREVVVTGIGMITPLGSTARETAAAWSAGRSASRQTLPELAGTPLENAGVAHPPKFDIAARLGGRRMMKYMSEAAALGCAAAREALDAADAKKRFASERMGLYAATGLAAASVDNIRATLEVSIDESGRFSERLFGARGLAVTNPLISFKILANMPPCLISVMEGIKGPNLIFTPWEGHAGAAILEAWIAVRDGLVDCALTGAADSAAHASTLVFLRQSGFLRDGEFPATAAAYLFFERAETAMRDGREIIAVIEDVAMNGSDAIPSDPLSARMGRLYAAAPPVLMAIESMTRGRGAALTGADGQNFSFRLGDSPQKHGATENMKHEENYLHE